MSLHQVSANPPEANECNSEQNGNCGCWQRGDVFLLMSAQSSGSGCAGVWDRRDLREKTPKHEYFLQPATSFALTDVTGTLRVCALESKVPDTHQTFVRVIHSFPRLILAVLTLQAEVDPRRRVCSRFGRVLRSRLPGPGLRCRDRVHRPRLRRQRQHYPGGSARHR